MTPSEELASAARHLADGKLAPRTDIAPLIAKLLTCHSQFASLYEQLHRINRGRNPTEAEYTAEGKAALALARAINEGSQT